MAESSSYSCKSCYYGTGLCNNSSNYCLSSYEHPSSCKSWYYGSDPLINNNSSDYDQIVVPFEHDSFSYCYELNNPDLINYDYLISTQFDISHSSHRFSEPNLTHYYPINHGYSSISSSYLMNHISETETNHQVVATSAAVDDDDFLEYDPTPYGGGYDQILTYGEPLQASDKICHPRSTFSVDPAHDLSYNSSNIVNPSLDNSNGNGGHDSNLGKPKTVNNDHDEEKCFEIVAEKALDLDLGNGRSGEMGQFLPYGYGLEAMDLCESLFGYWPCLSKELRRKPQDQEKEEDAEQEEQGYDQYWSCAQDYIFGSSSPYG